MINWRMNVEISWNKVNAYFQGYLCAHENSENFYTMKIPTLMVKYDSWLYIFCEVKIIIFDG